MLWSIFITYIITHHGLGGFSGLINGLIAAAIGALSMLMSEPTAESYVKRTCMFVLSIATYTFTFTFTFTESDLLDITNYYLEEQGKPTIKSSRTVALWQKPRKQSTREGQRHHQGANGRYMFTCKSLKRLWKTPILTLITNEHMSKWCEWRYMEMLPLLVHLP